MKRELKASLMLLMLNTLRYKIYIRLLNGTLTLYISIFKTA